MVNICQIWLQSDDSSLLSLVAICIVSSWAWYSAYYPPTFTETGMNETGRQSYIESLAASLFQKHFVEESTMQQA